MDAKEKKKLMMQKMKAEAAMCELEYKIMEREEEIERIKEHIAKQKEIINDLSNELMEG